LYNLYRSAEQKFAWQNSEDMLTTQCNAAEA